MFDYKTNRIINGICEWCGVKADFCEHYMDGRHLMPIDEAQKLTQPQYVPKITPGHEVAALTETEKAASAEAAKKVWQDTKDELPASK